MRENGSRKRRTSYILPGESINIITEEQGMLKELAKIKEERDKANAENKKLNENIKSVEEKTAGYVDLIKELEKEIPELQRETPELRQKCIEADKRLNEAQKENEILKVQYEKQESRFNALAEEAFRKKQTVGGISDVDASNLRKQHSDLKKRLTAAKQELTNEQKKNRDFYDLNATLASACNETLEKLKQAAESAVNTKNYKAAIELSFKAMGIGESTSNNETEIQTLQNQAQLCYDYLSRTEFIANEGLVMRKELEQKIIQVQNKATIAETNLRQVRKGASVLSNQNKDLQIELNSAEDEINQLNSNATTLKDEFGKKSIECQNFYQQLLDADHHRDCYVAKLKQNGEALIDNGQYADALEVYNKALSVEGSTRQNSDHLAFLWSQIAVCWANGFNNLPKAINAVNNAIHHSPLNALYLFTRALLHQKNGNIHAAIEDLQVAIHFKPDFVDANNLLSNLLRK